MADLAKARLKQRKGFARVGEIEFVQYQESRLLQQRRIPGFELVFDRRFLLYDLFDRFRSVEQMHEHPRAFDVLEKLIAETNSLVRAFEQSGNVDDNERFVIGDAHDAQLWFQRRERILRDFRPRRRHDREQCRLSGIGNADDTAIRQQPQLETERETFPGFAVFGKARRLPHTGREVLIAESAAPPACSEHAHSGLVQIGEKLLGGVVARSKRDRTNGHRDREIRAAASRFLRTSARFAGLRRKVPPEAKLNKRREFGRSLEIDAAAMTTVAAGGAALRNVLLAAPRDDAVTSVSRGDGDLDLVNELHRCYVRRVLKRGLTAPFSCDCAALRRAGRPRFAGVRGGC